MLIKQSEFFKDLGFEKQEFKYGSEKRECYKGADGGYYRVDHFGKNYVTEFAEGEKEASMNQFEDVDLYDDSLGKDRLINQIQSDLKKYVTE